jgi:dCTP deaminase
VILSDRSIHEAIANGRLGIDPFDPNLVQPSSIDVRLDNKFLVFRNTKRAFIDVKQPADDLMEMIEVGRDEPMFLHPHEFVLGSTVERVRMPDDLVARLEGRSSLGRLGVVIHSSLPYDEPVWFKPDQRALEQWPIGEIVQQKMAGKVLAFDRDTLEVGLHRVTNWFSELPDRIYEVRLASGRSIRVTAGHNLFTLDAAGGVVKAPTRALRPGTRIAIPGIIGIGSSAALEYPVLDLVQEPLKQKLVCKGPTVEVALEFLPAETHGQAGAISSGVLPVAALSAAFGRAPELGVFDRVAHDESGEWLPAVLQVDEDLAWLLGVCLARGRLRGEEVVMAEAEEPILDRAAAILASFGASVSRTAARVVCESALLAAVLDGLGILGKAGSRRLPPAALEWPARHVEALLNGLQAAEAGPTVRAESAALASDVLLLCAGLGRRARLEAFAGPAYAVEIAPVRAGHTSHADSLWTVPPQRASHVGTRGRVGCLGARSAIDCQLAWDQVVAVAETGRFEVVYDLEVRSETGRVENFLAGHGGVFASNTAGFIDPSFDGHVTLEISNLANLPIALYPGMRIGQLSFSLMTTPADKPYGPDRGSKYSGQALPTASRLYLDFQA